MNTNKSIADIMSVFTYKHLPPHLQDISKQFCEIAYDIVEKCNHNIFLQECLINLMQAKDRAVQAFILSNK